jgi:UDP-N-acetylbacillosamine transaminase
MIDRRLEINRMYREAFGDAVEYLPVPDWSRWNGWLSCVVFEDPRVRDSVMSMLAANDIESRPLWKPLHLQPVFAESERLVDGTSERLFRHGLCLPSGSALSDRDVERVVDAATPVLQSG